VTPAETTRNGPTEDHPATPALQLRVRVDAPGPLDEHGLLHLVVELYERRGSQWARLTCRVTDRPLEALLQGEGWTEGLHDLDYWRMLPPGTEKPRP
jgi:hypothetical protein